MVGYSTIQVYRAFGKSQINRKINSKSVVDFTIKSGPASAVITGKTDSATVPGTQAAPESVLEILNQNLYTCRARKRSWDFK